MSSFRPSGGPLGVAPERREVFRCRGNLQFKATAGHFMCIQGLKCPQIPRMAHVSSSITASSKGIDADCKPIVRPAKGKGEFDVVLSSGFLAFAQHTGFLQAVEDAGLPIKHIMGTSAGALSGSLYAAGYTPAEVAHILSRDPPYKLLKPCWPWEGGLLSMQPVVDKLSEHLPATFEELPTSFACGVCCQDGRHRVINSGCLPEAVVASAAIPVLFAPIKIPGQDNGPFHDGGKVDRIGLKQWRNFRRRHEGTNARMPPALVHLIARSSPFSGNDTLQKDESGITMVKSPKSGVSLLSLGDVQGNFELSRKVCGINTFPAICLVLHSRSSGTWRSISLSAKHIQPYAYY